MSKTKQPTEKPASEQEVLKALGAKPQATAAEIASTAGLGRSTVSKVLARLVSAGEVRRTEGGRDGARRLPDRFAPASAEPATEAAKPKTAEKLKPGQLDGLVLTFLKENADSSPHGPGAVAKALGRSGGAVQNCLVRLARAKQVREVSERPRRYSLAT
jgi:predicted transcriptional regulator